MTRARHGRPVRQINAELIKHLASIWAIYAKFYVQRLPYTLITAAGIAILLLLIVFWLKSDTTVCAIVRFKSTNLVNWHRQLRRPNQPLCSYTHKHAHLQGPPKRTHGNPQVNVWAVGTFRVPRQTISEWRVCNINTATPGRLTTAAVHLMGILIKYLCTPSNKSMQDVGLYRSIPMKYSWWSNALGFGEAEGGLSNIQQSVCGLFKSSLWLTALLSPPLCVWSSILRQITTCALKRCRSPRFVVSGAQ